MTAEISGNFVKITDATFVDFYDPEKRSVLKCVKCGKMMKETDSIGHECANLIREFEGIQFRSLNNDMYMCLTCNTPKSALLLAAHAAQHRAKAAENKSKPPSVANTAMNISNSIGSAVRAEAVANSSLNSITPKNVEGAIKTMLIQDKLPRSSSESIEKASSISSYLSTKITRTQPEEVKHDDLMRLIDPKFNIKSSTTPHESSLSDSRIEVPTKRGPGRPKGSKNLAKSFMQVSYESPTSKGYKSSPIEESTSKFVYPHPERLYNILPKPAESSSIEQVPESNGDISLHFTRTKRVHVERGPVMDVIRKYRKIQNHLHKLTKLSERVEEVALRRTFRRWYKK